MNNIRGKKITLASQMDWVRFFCRNAFYRNSQRVIAENPMFLFPLISILKFPEV